MNKDFSQPDYWPIFWHILRFFKLLGILPLSFVRIKAKNKDVGKLEVRFSKLGYVVAIVFLVLSIVHTIWAPIMLIRLEKSIIASLADLTIVLQNGTNSNRRSFSTKLGDVVKVLHPVFVSLTTLSARVLSVTILARSMPVLFKSIAQVDRLLNLPSTFYLANFGTLTAVTVVSFVVHIPVMVFHFWQLYEFYDFWENLWEAVSMANVFTSFALELEFVLFCLSARSRFKYINDLLTTFVSEEFLYDAKSGGNLKKVFSKWKSFSRPRNRRIFTNSIKAKEELFKLFSKMDATNGGRVFGAPKQSFIDVIQKKKAPEPQTSSLLGALRSGHILLFDVLQNINDLYQVHLLVSIFFSVTEVMFNIYFTIFGFIHTMKIIPERIQNGELYLITCWSIYYCFRFMLIVNTAHFTAAASKDAIKTVSKIDPRNFEFLSKQEIKMLADHLSRRDFEFSACGLFNLNSSLISASFSTGITYLVIMAQFH